MVPAIEPSRRTSISAPAARGVEPRSPISFTSAKSSPPRAARGPRRGSPSRHCLQSSLTIVQASSWRCRRPAATAPSRRRRRRAASGAHGARPSAGAASSAVAAARSSARAGARREHLDVEDVEAPLAPQAARARRAPAAARTAASSTAARSSVPPACRRARPQNRARTRSSRRSRVPHGHGSGQEPAAVAGAVADQRHGLARQRREDDLAVLAVRDRRAASPGPRPRTAGRPRAGDSRPGPRTRRRRRGPSPCSRSGRRRGSPTRSSTAATSERGAWSVLSSTLSRRTGAPAAAPRRASPSTCTGMPTTASKPPSRSTAAHAPGPRPGRGRRPPRPSARGPRAAGRPRCPGRSPGSRMQHALPGPHEHRHAVVEEVEGELLVGGREVDALGLARGPRRRERDDPVDLSRMHAEEAHALRADVVGGGQGKPGEVVQGPEVARLDVAQQLRVEGAALTHARDGRAQGAQLVRAKLLDVARARPSEDPRLERRAPRPVDRRGRHRSASAGAAVR